MITRVLLSTILLLSISTTNLKLALAQQTAQDPLGADPTPEELEKDLANIPGDPAPGIDVDAIKSPPGVELPAKLIIDINKKKQAMVIKRDGKEVASFKVSTGREGYLTPSGTYTPIETIKDAYSVTYKSPMPWSVFFIGRKYAIHGTSHLRQLGTKASRGCVRLTPEDAKRVYDWAREVGLRRTRIVIHD